MDGSVGIENGLWYGRSSVRISAEKGTYIENMETEYEAMQASCSADTGCVRTWKSGRGSGWPLTYR